MNKSFLRRLKGIYFVTFSIGLTVICFSVSVISESMTRTIGWPRDGRGIHLIASIWGQAIMSMVPGWRVSVIGRENIPPPENPCVIVSNHQSMVDIWIMYFLRRQFRWIGKMEAFDIPGVGWAMGWAKYVPVRRGDRESHATALRESMQRIREGLWMIFFPEGTRSLSGELGPFKAGAFRVAIDTNSQILPVVIQGAGNLLRKGSLMPGVADVTLKILPAVSHQPDEKPGDYANRVRTIIANNLSPQNANANQLR